MLLKLNRWLIEWILTSDYTVEANMYSFIEIKVPNNQKGWRGA